MWPPGPWPGPRELWRVGDNSARLGVQDLGSDPGQPWEAGLGLCGRSLSLLACGEELRAPRCQLTVRCGSALGWDQGQGSLMTRAGAHYATGEVSVCEEHQHACVNGFRTQAGTGAHSLAGVSSQGTQPTYCHLPPEHTPQLSLGPPCPALLCPSQGGFTF